MVWLGTTSIRPRPRSNPVFSGLPRSAKRIYNLQEMWTGRRLTTSVTRVGGIWPNIPDDFVAGLREFHPDLSADV